MVSYLTRAQKHSHILYCQGDISCNFDSGYCSVWSDATDDDFNWTRNTGRTPSAGTGPLADHTSGSGYYMFIETSNPRLTYDTAILQSVEVKWGDETKLCIQFW